MNFPTSLWFAAYDIDGCHFAVYTHFFFYPITSRCRGEPLHREKERSWLGMLVSILLLPIVIAGLYCLMFFYAESE